MYEYEIMELKAINMEWLKQYFGTDELVSEEETNHLVMLAQANKFDGVPLTLRLEVQNYANSEPGDEGRNAFREVAKFFV